MQKLMHELASAEGACCVYGYILLTMNVPVSDLAAHLGVTEGAIYQWRRKVRHGRLTCLLFDERKRQQYPDSLLDTFSEEKCLVLQLLSTASD